jgi:hypothetical protein
MARGPADFLAQTMTQRKKKKRWGRVGMLSHSLVFSA